MARTVDLSALNQNVNEGINRLLENAFDIPNGGGMLNDIKALGSEGTTSYFHWDYSEDKCFIQRTTTDTGPGRLVYIQHLGSAIASGQNIQGMQIRARATGTGTIAGGTDGAEIKSGLNSDSDTGTIAQARGVIGNVDAKKGTITTAHLFEGQVDVGAGGTITTLKGFRASMNNSGTITTGYAFIVETANTTYNWDYGLYMADDQADTGIYIGNCSTRCIDIANTITGTTAQNCVEINNEEATTMSIGYSHAIHVAATNSGAKSGGASVTQYNAIGVDYTISAGGAAGFYALYAYMTKSGSPDCSSSAIAGVNVELTEMGATDYFAGVWVNKYNTTPGTSVDAFLLLANQGSGVTTSMIRMLGTSAATYFVRFDSVTGDCLTTDAGTPGANSTHKLAVRIGTTTYYIPIYADY